MSTDRSPDPDASPASTDHSPQPSDSLVSIGRARDRIDLAAIAREIGFHRAAIVPIEPPRRHALYTSWLAAGHAGEMAYLAGPAHIAQRADLTTLLANARSLVVVALAYEGSDPTSATCGNGPGSDPTSATCGDTAKSPAQVAKVGSDPRGRIARYARGDDYHLVMRDKLVMLADRLSRELGRPVASRPCVDSAPVLEREWAERAGLGFIAKNTMLIAPGLGSYVLLGELLVDAELAPTAPETPPRPRCGSCTACLDACPTRAFVDAYTLDARRCISYLTIEYEGVIPRELRAAIGTWIFGCDICQEVCPFNAGAGEPPDPQLRPRSLEHALPDLVALAARGANQMRQFVKRTAMRRVSREILLRNVAVALGNTGSAEAIPALAGLLAEKSALVRAHAVWALRVLGAADVVRAHRDDDPLVLAELD